MMVRKRVVYTIIILVLVFSSFYIHNTHSKHTKAQESQGVFYIEHKEVLPINYSSLTLNNTILEVRCRNDNVEQVHNKH